MFIFLQSMELTGEALEFLKGVFSMFDIDNVCEFFVYKSFNIMWLIAL